MTDEAYLALSPQDRAIARRATPAVALEHRTMEAKERAKEAQKKRKKKEKSQG